MQFNQNFDLPLFEIFLSATCFTKLLSIYFLGGKGVFDLFFVLLHTCNVLSPLHINKISANNIIPRLKLILLKFLKHYFIPCWKSISDKLLEKS